MINVSSSPRVLILLLLSLLLFLEWKFYLHAFKTHIQLSSVDLTSHKTIYVTFAKVSLFRAHTKLNRFQSITQPNCIEYSTHLHEFHTLIQMNDASFDAHNLLCWFSLQFFSGSGVFGWGRNFRLHHLPSIRNQSSYMNKWCEFTYPDMVQRNMHSIFHGVRLAHLTHPIQHWDRIHSSQCPIPLYCCHLSSDLCALNQSKVFGAQHLEGWHPARKHKE